MKKYWFKAKKYGYGWQPSSWQGWLVIIAFGLVVGLNAVRFSQSALVPSQRALTYFFIQNLVFIALLILICVRTGEKPRWQWGNKKKWKTANDELNRDL